MAKPIETSLGELHGRDAIYLDDERIDDDGQTLVLVGEVNGTLCTKQRTGEFIPYTVKFSNVSGFEKTELEEWLALDKPLFHETSSFYVSDGACENEKSFVFQTYDWVYEVRCEAYEITFEKNT